MPIFELYQEKTTMGRTFLQLQYFAQSCCVCVICMTKWCCFLIRVSVYVLFVSLFSGYYILLICRNNFSFFNKLISWLYFNCVVSDHMYSSMHRKVVRKRECAFKKIWDLFAKKCISVWNFHTNMCNAANPKCSPNEDTLQSRTSISKVIFGV